MGKKARLADHYKATRDHVRTVQRNIQKIIHSLTERMIDHDDSKFGPDESDVFAEVLPNLAGLTYGSEEYKEQTARLGPALQHHYRHNDHHPEYHPDGVAGMDLVQLLEMICDWKAATERHDDGDIWRSLKINADRFGIEPQLLSVLGATVANYFDD